MRDTKDIVHTVLISPDASFLAVRGYVPDPESNDVRIHLFPLGPGEPKALRLHVPQLSPVELSITQRFRTGITKQIVYSPDSSILATVVPPNVIALCNPRTGKEIARLAGHDTEVRCLSFSPDGKFLASAAEEPPQDDDGNAVLVIRIWEIASHKQRDAIRIHEAPVDCIVWSPDGRTIAGGRADGTIFVWETITRQEIIRRKAPGSAVRCLAFSPTANELVSGHADGSALLWQIAPHPDADRHPTSRGLVQLWDDLGAANARKAYQTVGDLVATPEATVKFLQKHLRPVEAGTAERIRQLIADLDSNDFHQRETATRELGRLGEQVEAPLRTALASTKSEEVRKRALPLLKALEAWVITDPDRLRVIRSIWVLEHIGSKDAIALLRRLADGAPGAAETEDAKAALTRLGER